jgi:hypothetical protein
MAQNNKGIDGVT